MRASNRPKGFLPSGLFNTQIFVRLLTYTHDANTYNLACNKEGTMGHNIEKLEGKMKKNVGRITGNKKMEIKGAIKENTAKLKDRFD